MDTQSNVTSTAELEAQLGQIRLAIDEVVPQRLGQWLTAFACSNGTTSEMLLCSALVSTSSLLGNTTLKLFGSYEEKSNLHLIATAPSGTGKTPACQKGCVEQLWAMSRKKYKQVLSSMKHRQVACLTIFSEVCFLDIAYYPLCVEC